MTYERKQLYLDESTDRALKRLAARTGRSDAWHVREALRTYGEREVATDDDPFGERDAGLGHDSVAELVVGADVYRLNIVEPAAEVAREQDVEAEDEHAEALRG